MDSCDETAHIKTPFQLVQMISSHVKRHSLKRTQALDRQTDDLVAVSRKICTTQRLVSHFGSTQKANKGLADLVKGSWKRMGSNNPVAFESL